VSKKAVYDDIVDNLRARSWIYFSIAIGTFAVVFNFSSEIIEALGDKLLPEGATLIYLSPAEYLILRMKIAGYAAISICFLVSIIQIWHVIRARSLLPEIGVEKLIGAFIISLALFIVNFGLNISKELSLIVSNLISDFEKISSFTKKKIKLMIVKKIRKIKTKLLFK